MSEALKKRGELGKHDCDARVQCADGMNLVIYVQS